MWEFYDIFGVTLSRCIHFLLGSVVNFTDWLISCWCDTFLSINTYMIKFSNHLINRCKFHMQMAIDRQKKAHWHKLNNRTTCGIVLIWKLHTRCQMSRWHTNPHWLGITVGYISICKLCIGYTGDRHLYKWIRFLAVSSHIWSSFLFFYFLASLQWFNDLRKRSNFFASTDCLHI